jgi:hypothetical protein
MIPSPPGNPGEFFPDWVDNPTTPTGPSHGTLLPEDSPVIRQG